MNGFNWLADGQDKITRETIMLRIISRSSPISVFFLAIWICHGYAQTSNVASKPETAIDEKCQLAAQPYKKARSAYEKKARVYWKQVADKKTLRKRKRRKKIAIARADYVLTHPPKYKGPKRPKCLDKGKKDRKRKRRYIGIVSDFLKAAQKHYKYKPRFVKESEFKYIYASEALSQGLTAEQVVGVYALETGGLGPYSRQSGIFNVTQNCKRIKPKGRPASTALGYAQLLAANTVAVLKENGAAFSKDLERRALLKTGERRRELLNKAKMLRKMVRDIKKGILKYKNRNNWREFVKFAKTPKGFAIHTLNLDADVGPRLQVRKLKKIVSVAKRKGYKKVRAAQLELMNLVGFGRGLEMMRPIARDVPTANFFSRGGYQRNPVAKNLTANGLLKRMERIIAKKRKKCGSVEFLNIFRQISQR